MATSTDSSKVEHTGTSNSCFTFPRDDVVVVIGHNGSMDFVELGLWSSLLIDAVEGLLALVLKGNKESGSLLIVELNRVFNPQREKVGWKGGFAIEDCEDEQGLWLL